MRNGIKKIKKAQSVDMRFLASLGMTKSGVYKMPLYDGTIGRGFTQRRGVGWAMAKNN